MGEEAQITREEFIAVTVSPASALTTLASAGLNQFTAKREIIKRLENGLIQAFAETAIACTHYGERETKHFPGLTDNFWREANLTYDADFWITGQIDSGEHAAFGVRFKPDGIAKIHPTEPHRIPAVSQNATAEPDSSARVDENRRSFPPVPDASLKAWFDFWSKTYPPKLQNEVTGHTHALASFPKHSITRLRIRDLRGPQKRGPKRSAK